MADLSSPKVSIVLPVFNGENTIEPAVNSIIHQTFTNWELIVINDGSTDRSLDIVQGFDDPRIKILSQARSGIARALNFGLRIAQGEYIARMDADDESHPERLAKQVAHLNEHSEVGLVATQVEHIGGADQYGYKTHVAWSNDLISTEQLYLARFQDAPLAHPSVMFRKSLFFQHGGYNEQRVPEDFELWLRWFDQGIKMSKLPQVLLKWYDSPSRLSRVDDHYADDAFYLVKARYFKKWWDRQERSRPLWVFGTGRVVNNRVKHLIDLGLTIEKWIDIKPHSEDRFLHYKDLKNRRTSGAFILSYVSDRIGKLEIHKFLVQKGDQDGVDFLMMA